MRIVEFGTYHRESDNEYFAFEIVQYAQGAMYLKACAVDAKWGQRIDGSLDWHKGEITMQAGCGSRTRIDSEAEGYALLEIMDGFVPPHSNWLLKKQDKAED